MTSPSTPDAPRLGVDNRLLQPFAAGPVPSDDVAFDPVDVAFEEVVGTGARKKSCSSAMERRLLEEIWSRESEGVW